MDHQESLAAYLQPSDYINFQHPRIQALIPAFNQKPELERIQAAYEFVRDEIAHSYDMKGREVTRTASDVLEMQHGICYAKSHLLAAILRGMGIPAGIGYQKLTLYDKPEDGYCIHALNTVYLRESARWIRLDARGNKVGIHAEFSIHEEKLAFPIRTEFGEKDYPNNFAEPHPAIIKTLENSTNCMDMYQNGLPEDLSEW